MALLDVAAEELPGHSLLFWDPFASSTEVQAFMSEKLAALAELASWTRCIIQCPRAMPLACRALTATAPAHVARLQNRSSAVHRRRYASQYPDLLDSRLSRLSMQRDASLCSEPRVNRGPDGSIVEEGQALMCRGPISSRSRQCPDALRSGAACDDDAEADRQGVANVISSNQAVGHCRECSHIAFRESDRLWAPEGELSRCCEDQSPGLREMLVLREL